MKLSVLFIVAVTAIAFSDEIKVACIGNSITEGNMGGAYPGYLQEKLGGDYQVLNAGVSGTTLLKKGDKPYWVYGKLQDVFNFQPDIITIKLGTNDSKPQNWDTYGNEFKDDYNALIDTLNTIASVQVIYPVLPVPVFMEQWGINNETIDLIIPIIKEIGEERNLTVIDANTPLQEYGHCFAADGVHPDNEGAEKIADVLYTALIASTGTIPLELVTKTSLSNRPQRNVTLRNRFYQDDASSFSLNGRCIPGRGKLTKGAAVLITIPPK